MSRIKMLLSWNTLMGIPQILFLYIPFWIVSCFYKKNIWLFSERPSDARDNGYVLYKWVKENVKSQKVIYVIRKKSSDYKKVESLGEVINYGSLKHWYYYFTAEVICSTDWNICCPNDITFLAMRNILPPKNKRVFLQHGITKDFMAQGLKSKLKSDLFVCGAYPEYEYVNRNFGYKNDEVQYLGFPRFDNLIDMSSMNNYILFMPTWRIFIADSNFIDTQYYKKIQSLLTSRSLLNFLQNENLTLIYFLHPAIKNKKKFFKQFESKHIKIVSNDDCDMQHYICSAKMLITDYSSIYFDFAYQNKPVIYYQYDYEDYRDRHYSEGYFSYENDGFGPICKDEEDLIQNVVIISKDWIVQEKYLDRIKRFFPVRDKNNCLRNFHAIKTLTDCKLIQ